MHKTMFQYEYEKRPPSSTSCDSRATMTTEWSRDYPSATRTPSRGSARTVEHQQASLERSMHARRPLPPRPIVCERIPGKTIVPLKVWIIASASCFAVCAALVLATVVITKWGASSDTYSSRTIYSEPEPVYANPKDDSPVTKSAPTTTEAETATTTIAYDDLPYPILEKLSSFKNIVGKREKIKKEDNKKPDLGLIAKPQIHPIHDTTLYHAEKRIEKKDKALHTDIYISESRNAKKSIPEFKPTLPDVFINKQNEIKLPDGYITGFRNPEFYEDYYNDENLYDDYMQSNTMTSYLIEKVQELHDWITSDSDFEMPNNMKQQSGNQFGQLLKALNESLIEGNVNIVMNKLRDIYFGENHTTANHSRKVILSNSTDLLSFGILTLDVMLLHNIQLMAWENQETARIKMMKDPDVFAFNALFMDPGKVEAKQNEIHHHHDKSMKRQNRFESDNLDFGKSILDNVLEIGMSSARAAIHLGRAYKNTKNILSQLSNRESLNANIQNQISRNIDGNSHALNHLQTSYNKNDSSAANTTGGFYTEMDCMWMLYCKNLAATTKLNPPYGTMARINGMALRMLAGELSADKALDTMLYEALGGWSDLKCNDLFPRCSKVNAATIVMDSILQPIRRSQAINRS